MIAEFRLSFGGWEEPSARLELSLARDRDIRVQLLVKA